MRYLYVLVVVVLAGCASEAKPPSKYPPREPGCDVQVFPETPSYQTDNIGSVTATCDEADACLAELKDQACKLGADTVWGVGDAPSNTAGKKSRSGRAAHRK